MASRKPRAKKKRLVKASKHRKWAPFWLIPKVFGPGRKVHPARITSKKRSWRRQRIKG